MFYFWSLFAGAPGSCVSKGSACCAGEQDQGGQGLNVLPVVALCWGAWQLCVQGWQCLLRWRTRPRWAGAECFTFGRSLLGRLAAVCPRSAVLVVLENKTKVGRG